MMEFDPRKRISAIDALAHPWLAQLHDPAVEPSAPSVFEFEEAEGGWTEAEVRQRVWQEVRCFPRRLLRGHAQVQLFSSVQVQSAVQPLAVQISALLCITSNADTQLLLPAEGNASQAS
jgi:serine/threonine protein kinase